MTLLIFNSLYHKESGYENRDYMFLKNKPLVENMALKTYFSQYMSSEISVLVNKSATEIE